MSRQIVLKSPRTARTSAVASPPARFSPGEPARWALLALLAAAPWAYGFVLPSTWPWLTGALLGVTGLWIGGLLVSRRWPAVGWPLLTLALFLLGHGWTVTLNAGFRYDRELYQFLAIKPLLAAWLPQAIDNAEAIPAMGRFTGLLGILLLAADASQHAAWRRRLFWTLTFNGALFVVYGLCQRALPDFLRYWRPEDFGHSLFGPYFYHGNAGAFVNLMLPFAFGAAVRGFTGERTPSQRGFGAAALFLNLAGAVAIASKAAQCVTLALLAALVFVYRREIGLGRSGAGVVAGEGRRMWGRAAAALLLGVGCVAALALSSDLAVERWEFLPKLLTKDNPRLVADQACLRMLPDAGWWGIGPRNFSIAFPHYTNGMSFALLGRWSYAHEDYLQTVIEWGYIGAAVWGTLIFGALWRGHWSARNGGAVQTPASPSLDSLLHRSAWLALGGALLHAAVDFPLQIGSIQVCALTFAGLLWGRFSRGQAMAVTAK